MKLVLRIAALVSLVATSAWAGSNLNLSKSNINRVMMRGTLVSATATITGAMSALLYTVPTGRDFILTQACTGSAEGGILLEVGGAGLAQLGTGLCQTFNPGILLPVDQPLSCTSFSASVNTFCMITGILGPPNATPTPGR